MSSIPAPPSQNSRMVLWVCILAVVSTLIYALFYVGHNYAMSVGVAPAPECEVRYFNDCPVKTMNGTVLVRVEDKLQNNRGVRSYIIITPTARSDPQS